MTATTQITPAVPNSLADRQVPVVVYRETGGLGWSNSGGNNWLSALPRTTGVNRLFI